MTLLITPDGLDKAIDRAPLLSLGGLLLAIASPLWGGAGCICAGTAALAGVLTLIHIDWRCGGRLLATLFLVPTVGLAALLGGAVGAGVPAGRLLDLGLALVVILSYVRFLLGILLRRGIIIPEVRLNAEVLADALARIPPFPVRQQIQTGRDGIRPYG